MMVVEVVSDTELAVIHYTGAEQLEEGVDLAASSASPSSGFGSFSFSAGGQLTGEVKEEVLQIEPSEVQLLEYKDAHKDTYSVEESLERARSRVGEKRYSVVLNNCEHFVNWSKTGTAQSHQTQVGGQAILKGVASGWKAGKGNGSVGWGLLVGLGTAARNYLQSQNDTQH